jgi:hypothetical protein
VMQRSFKPFLPFRDSNANTHKRCMNTDKPSVFRGFMNLSEKRTIPHFWCCTLLHGILATLQDRFRPFGCGIPFYRYNGL